MKKFNEKRLYFVSSHWLKLLIMTKMYILFLICSVTTVSAGVSSAGFGTLQQNTIKGTVKDAKTGESLIGVSVVVKGTTQGTLTDINGTFSIPINTGQTTLSFSFIGYTTQEVAATPGSNLIITMQQAITQISEVVVVGYSTQKKESVVGAITQVNNAQLVNSAASNITNAIAGKLSGVLTIQQTGEPGNDQASIYIRGLSSWSSSAPLVLVDGVERNFQDMDPNEISSISVLKDASATAVFGAKGANGVIIVTSKRGVTGKPQMTVSYSTGVQEPIRKPDFIDSYTTMSMANVAKMNGQFFTSLNSQYDLNQWKNPSTPLQALKYTNVDWFDLLVRPVAPQINANVTVTGGTDFVKYFCTIGYLNESSIFKQDNRISTYDSRFWYNRFNFRANLDFSLTKSTLLSLNVGGEIGVKNGPTEWSSSSSNYGAWKSLYGSTGATYPAFWPEWVLEQVPDPDYPDAKGIRLAASNDAWFTNSFTNVNQGSFDRQLNNTLFTDLILDQKLDFILKGLSARGKVSLSTYYQSSILGTKYSFPSYKLDFSKIGVDANGDGIVDQNPWQRDALGLEQYYNPDPMTISVGGLNSGYYTNLYYEGSLNYSNTFGRNAISGLLLMNRQQKNAGTDFPFYNAAYVGRATYAYDKRYLLEVNVGYTGSEQFAPGNRYGFFPSGALGWVISEEKFFRNAVPWMNKLKIRYSDGQVGSDAASSRWLYMSDYFKDQWGYIHQSASANSSAQWEVARKKDLGLEIGIFQNLFSFSVDLFDEQRSKMLLTPLTTTFLIGNTFKDLNLGRMKKHGIEIEAEYNKTTAGNLNFWIRGNFGFNENRVIFKDDPFKTPDYLKAAGKPIGGQLSGITTTGTGYYTTIDDIHINPASKLLEKVYVGDYKQLDYNSDGTINNTDNHPVKGSYYPPIVYAASTGFSYKGFNFSIMFQGNAGKYTNIGENTMIEFYRGSYRVHTANLDYWRPDNQDATYGNIHYATAGSDEPGNVVGVNWRNSSYLRLKEIYAGYTFNSAFLKKNAGISTVLVYANGTNLLTFTKLLKEYDPEITSIDLGAYPQISRFNLGMKVTF
jgi:TonB-linked SusC/RagA family outer membrane protein